MLYKLLQNLRISPAINGGLKESRLYPTNLLGFVPSRSTYILKRRYPVRLLKKGRDSARLKAKNYIYDLVEDTDVKKKNNVKIILKTYVEGLGNEGDCVDIKRNEAYNKLLLSGLADYATPESIKQFEEKKKLFPNEKLVSSPYALQTVKYLSHQVLGVVMNKESEWTLESWHIRVAFRKAGINVPESAITMPEKPIRGPDLNLELKDFLVTVTINKKEEAKVRCRIHHWSTNPGDRLPYVKYPWTLECEPLFEEHASVLATLPLPTHEKEKTN